jgi:phosphoesterase RecJ-like protein
MPDNKIYKKHCDAIIGEINKRDHFLITAHLSADGDAISSVLAMSYLLTALKKDFIMVLHDENIDDRFNYLKNFNDIYSYKEDVDFAKKLKVGKIETVIVVDAPGFRRMGDVQNIIPQDAYKIKIDHHPSEEVMGEVDWVEEDASSASALVFEVINSSSVNLTFEIAEAIFTGIVYDTGRFSFSNTHSRDFEIAAILLKLGVEPAKITEKMFFENSPDALKIVGKGLASMESYFDGQVNVIYISHEEMEKGDSSEIEILANYSVAIRHGKVGLFVREVKKDFHKVSLRAKGEMNVNAVAKVFDGGGHRKASGCKIEGSKESVINQLLAEIKKQL